MKTEKLDGIPVLGAGPLRAWPGGGFPSLGDGLSGEQEFKVIERELKAAGIPASGEFAGGLLRGWSFRRKWRYYVATSDVTIPLKEAAALNLEHGTECRAGGCKGGCTFGKGSPRYYSDFSSGVKTYHVDTPMALAALVAVIKGRTS